jgi:preprotein translocase subunit SecD
MRHCLCPLVIVLLAGSATALRSQDKTPEAGKKLPDGVYAVLRDGLKEKDLLPLKDGEVLLVHRHRYLKTDDKEPPRFLVVRSRPDVDLDLAGEPKAVKEGDEVVRLLLKLEPRAAEVLERVTKDQPGGQLAIVLGGEVVTVHKIRATIKGGEVQISSCAAGGAQYLLDQLQARRKAK